MDYSPMELKTKYDYLKKEAAPRELAGELHIAAIDRLRRNGTIFLAIDGKLSVILFGATSRKTFLQMGLQGNLKGTALQDYLILESEQNNLNPVKRGNRAKEPDTNPEHISRQQNSPDCSLWKDWGLAAPGM